MKDEIDLGVKEDDTGREGFREGEEADDEMAVKEEVEREAIDREREREWRDWAFGREKVRESNDD